MNSEPERPAFAGGKSSSRSSSPRYINAGECDDPDDLSSGAPKSSGAPPRSSRRPSSPSWLRAERVPGNYSALEKLILLTCISVLVTNLVVLVLGVILIVLIVR